jgi:hypothetical protein
MLSQRHAIDPSHMGNFAQSSVCAFHSAGSNRRCHKIFSVHSRCWPQHPTRIAQRLKKNHPVGWRRWRFKNSQHKGHRRISQGFHSHQPFLLRSARSLKAMSQQPVIFGRFNLPKILMPLDCWTQGEGLALFFQMLETSFGSCLGDVVTTWHDLRSRKGRRNSPQNRALLLH